MRPLIIGAVVVTALSACRVTEEVAGTITDSECSTADHAPMGMGATDAECTLACISAHGAAYVLYDGENAYTLSDQQGPEAFAGRRVTVRGTVDAATRTISVVSIESLDADRPQH